MMGKKILRQDKDCFDNICNNADPVLAVRVEFICIKTHPVVLHYLPLNIHPDLETDLIVWFEPLEC